jgi:tetrahydromethanopterin S-methyltransferase subunit H
MAAPALYWGSYIFEPNTPTSVGDVKAVTAQKMHEIGLANAAVHQSDVNASTQDTRVAVCYVGLGGNKWMAIVMAAGTHAKTLRDQLIAKFDSTIWL